MIFLTGFVLIGCGAEAPESEEEASRNVVQEKADSLHDSIDKAEEVEAMLDDKKTAIDEALDDAEGGGSD